MKLLLVNAGSSSLKYTLTDGKKRIKKEQNNITSQKEYDNTVEKMIVEAKKFSVEYVIHRIVHGYGQKKTEFYNEKIGKKILSSFKIAPLHSIVELKIIGRIKREKIRQICVFDSLPYDNLPEYPLPNQLIKKYNIKRFGFHGLSHKSMRESTKEKTIITVHLGSGSSVTGWKQNNTVFHSMGFSPNEGMVMMTRTGSIDPGILTFLMRQKYDADSIDNILNKESGMRAICKNNDFKTIISRMKKRNEYEKAYNAFVNSAAENILRATVYTGKPDRILFAGAIGEHSKKTVNDIMKRTMLKVKYSSLKTDEEGIMIEEAEKIIHKS